MPCRSDTIAPLTPLDKCPIAKSRGLVNVCPDGVRFRPSRQSLGIAGKNTS